MLNKINKRNKINKNYYGPSPSIINNYNKFLATIDSMTDLINIQKQENENENNILEQKTINETIDSLIEKIDSKFINDNLDSITGQSANDIILTNLKKFL